MESLSLLIIVSIITALISLCGGFLYLQGSKLASLIRQSGPFISAVIAFLAIFAVIMPEVSAMIPLWQVIVLMLISLVLFFMLERLAGRYHARSDTNTIRNKRQIFVMNLIDSIRSILDGVVIGVSFASGLGFGITAATVTAAHEIPQEVGDFAIMKRARMHTSKIAIVQIITGFLLVPAAIIAFFVAGDFSTYLPFVMPVVAGLFGYVVISEITRVVELFKKK